MKHIDPNLLIIKAGPLYRLPKLLCVQREGLCITVTKVGTGWKDTELRIVHGYRMAWLQEENKPLQSLPLKPMPMSPSKIVSCIRESLVMEGFIERTPVVCACGADRSVRSPTDFIRLVLNVHPKKRRAMVLRVSMFDGKGASHEDKDVVRSFETVLKEIFLKSDWICLDFFPFCTVKPFSLGDPSYIPNQTFLVRLLPDGVQECVAFRSWDGPTALTVMMAPPPSHGAPWRPELFINKVDVRPQGWYVLTTDPIQ